MNIYNMKLHETYHEDNGNIDITRVPDGWIYYYAFRQSSIFVPDTGNHAKADMYHRQMEMSLASQSMMQGTYKKEGIL